MAMPPYGPAIWFSLDEAAELMGTTRGRMRARCREGLPHEVHDGQVWIQLVHLPVSVPA